MVTLIRYANEGFKNHLQENGLNGCYVFIRKGHSQALNYDNYLHPELQHLTRSKDKKHMIKVSDDTLVHARPLPKVFISEDGLTIQMDCDNNELKKCSFIEQTVGDIVRWQLNYEKMVKKIKAKQKELNASGLRVLCYSMLFDEYIAYEAIYDAIE